MRIHSSQLYASPSCLFPDPSGEQATALADILVSRSVHGHSRCLVRTLACVVLQRSPCFRLRIANPNKRDVGTSRPASLLPFVRDIGLGCFRSGESGSFMDERLVKIWSTSEVPAAPVYCRRRVRLRSRGVYRNWHHKYYKAQEFVLRIFSSGRMCVPRTGRQAISLALPLVTSIPSVLSAGVAGQLWSTVLLSWPPQPTWPKPNHSPLCLCKSNPYPAPAPHLQIVVCLLFLSRSPSPFVLSALSIFPTSQSPLVQPLQPPHLHSTTRARPPWPLHCPMSPV